MLHVDGMQGAALPAVAIDQHAVVATRRNERRRAVGLNRSAAQLAGNGCASGAMAAVAAESCGDVAVTGTDSGAAATGEATAGAGDGVAACASVSATGWAAAASVAETALAGDVCAGTAVAGATVAAAFADGWAGSVAALAPAAVVGANTLLRTRCTTSAR